MNATELLDAMDYAIAESDATAIETLISAYPRSAQALLAYRQERRLADLAEHDLVAQGWMPVSEAAKYLPYSPITIRLLARTGALGAANVAKDDNWPFRTYISPEAISRLHRREYKRSGPRGPHKRGTE
jgi:hypothetical protein